MKPVDDELFAHIKDSLTEHEEAYVPGAWERFEKKSKPKTPWLWFAGLSSAAAVLLIGFALFYTADKGQNNNDLTQQVHHKPGQENAGPVTGIAEGPEPAKSAIENLNTTVTENKNLVEQRTNNNAPSNPIIVGLKHHIIVDPMKAAATEQSPVSVTQGTFKPEPVVLTDKKELTVAAVMKNETAKPIVLKKDSVETNKPRSFQEFLEEEVKSNRAVAAASKSSAKKNDKWEMGLMVAPSIGNAKKLNMGYGFSMDYALSNKVSISSGISYNEMAATKNSGGSGVYYDSPNTMAAMVSDTKSLKSVDANLVGIDIPLGIKYHLSKKFYTNVGVSAFAVLNQKQNNNYLQGSVEYSANADVANSAGFKAVFQQQTVSEAVPSGEIRGDKYLGFYNFSFGFKQPISGSKAFSVEPFMKLPMKEFTKENLYLIGTGVRLKFDF